MTKKGLLFSIVFTIFCSSGLLAQPGDPGGDPDNPIPISGIEILLAAGALFGIRSIVKRNDK